MMSEKGNLLIKTFEAESAEDIDKKVNEFRKENNIFFMEPRVNVVMIGADPKTIKKYYTYIVYYLQKNKVIREDMKKCPGCGVDIPMSYESHLKCGWKENDEK